MSHSPGTSGPSLREVHQTPRTEGEVECGGWPRGGAPTSGTGCGGRGSPTGTKREGKSEDEDKTVPGGPSGPSSPSPWSSGSATTATSCTSPSFSGGATAGDAPSSPGATPDSYREGGGGPGRTRGSCVDTAGGAPPAPEGGGPNTPLIIRSGPWTLVNPSH